MPKPLPYKRILLKMSGEVLMGDHEFGLDPSTVDISTRSPEIKDAKEYLNSKNVPVRL